MSTTSMVTIQQATEVFVRGYAFTKSFTHPYLPERVGPLWVVRDAPRRRGDYRTEEWIASDVAPAEIDRIAREHTRGRYVICAICRLDEPQEPVRAEFKALGYRLRGTEPLMVHALRDIPDLSTTTHVERVTTAEQAAQLARATRARPLQPAYLADDAPIRQYVARDGATMVGWVSSIAAGDATWCSNMFVMPEHRRRGIARAMLCRMLRDDQAAGARAAVLLASHSGAKLYPVVGYVQIGTLLLYSPQRATVA
jgi:GNAT superfamily N-acetyltransferase